MVFVSDFRRKRWKKGRKKSFSFADANREQKGEKERHIGTLVYSASFYFLKKNKIIQVYRETADASTVQCFHWTNNTPAV